MTRVQILEEIKTNFAEEKSESRRRKTNLAEAIDDQVKEKTKWHRFFILFFVFF